MPKIRIYVDTSVFGGTQDVEFAKPSLAFWAKVREGGFILVLSQQTVRELEQAPKAVKLVLDAIPPACVEHIPIDAEVEALAQAYLEAEVLGPSSRDDALHVAAATVGGADLIMSWNFKHMVRYDKIRQFNGVNALQGYRAIDIRSPLEVRYGESENV